MSNAELAPAMAGFGVDRAADSLNTFACVATPYEVGHPGGNLTGFAITRNNSPAVGKSSYHHLQTLAKKSFPFSPRIR
jgi:hypothetical protein